MFKKSQAALEFLTTYAWAFLVILIMVGALAYFGILNPSRLLPERCNFGTEIVCDKDRMVVTAAAVNTIRMQLTNGFGESVIIPQDGITITTDIANFLCTAYFIDTVDASGAGGISWATNDRVEITATCNGDVTLTADDKTKFNVEIDYYSAGAGVDYTKTIFGELYTAVQ